MSAKSISNTFTVNTIEDGLSAAIVELSQSVILYDAENDGKASAAANYNVSYSLKVNGVICDIASANDIVIACPSGVTVSNKTTTGCRFNIAKNAVANGVITIEMLGMSNLITYTAKASISVNANKKGDAGERGKVGRFYYYAGDFDTNNTKPFPVNDAEAPFFRHIESGQPRYHVFNPETNPQGGSLTMSQMWEASDSNWNNLPWQQMTDDYEYLITKAIFGDFAKFGSAIISGDWMLSTNGTINGTAYNDGINYNNQPAYMWFDPLYPNTSVDTTHNVNGKSWSGYNFVPNYCVDLLTGATYQQEAFISGEIHAQSLSTEFVDVPYNDRETYYVNLDSNYNVKEEKVWNYRFVPNHTNDRLEIVLPVNKYAHFGQRIILYNPALTIVGGQSVAQSYITVKSLIVDGGLTTRRPILGISATDAGSWELVDDTPSPINPFEPIDTIWFANGVLELVCVPPFDSDTNPNSGAICDWAMVNIGTNYYGVSKFL